MQIRDLCSTTLGLLAVAVLSIGASGEEVLSRGGLHPLLQVKSVTGRTPAQSGGLAGTGCEYANDKGAADNSFGQAGAAAVGAAAGYVTVDGCTTLTAIQVAWGAVAEGQPCTLQIYNDPNKDGDPTDITGADQLVSVNGVTANVDSDVFNTYDIPPTVVEGMFWVVAITEDTGDDDFPMNIDEEPVASPLNYLLLGITDPNNPFDGTVLGEADTGPGNYMIRATGDGTVVSCFGGDTNGDCQVNVTDLVNVISGWGGSGLGSDYNADLNSDGTVDVTDLVGGVITNWGSCDCTFRACCFENGTCADITLDGCFRIGGAIQGPGSTCADAQCVNLLGGCCLLDGSCLDNLPAECDAVFGVHQGVGTSCGSGACDADPNDLCANAIALSFGETVSGSTSNSTADPEALDCPDETGAPQDVTAPGNWYTVIGNGTTLTASMCSSPSPYDGKLFVYCGTSCDQLFCLTSNDDGCGPAGPSEATWCSDSGQQYYVYVTGFGDSTGAYQLTVSSGGSCGEPTACLDDDDICEFATPLSIGQTIDSFDTCQGTPDAGAPDCGQGGQSAPGRWLRILGNGAQLTVTLCSPVPLNLNTRLSVYCGPCGDLQCAVVEPNNNSGCAPFTERAIWCSQEGAEYYILVSGSGAACGPVNVTLTSNGLPCNNPPCQPELGACCINAGTDCLDGVTFEECELAPGKWFFNQECAAVKCPIPVANDFCQTAIDLGSSLPVSVEFDNTNASSGPDGAPFVTCNPFGDSPGILSDLWYTWTAPAGGVVRFATCNGGLDTKMVVYEGNSCPFGDEEDIACSDDDCGSASDVLIPVAGGTTYTIRVGGWGTDDGGQGATGSSTLFIEAITSP